MDRKKVIFRCLPLLLSLILAFSLIACAGPLAKPEPAAAPQAVVAPPAEVPAPAPEVAPVPVVQPEPVPAVPKNPYEATLAPLTVADCGRCHSSYFNMIKKEGGRHQFDCRDCHQKFHAYNPQRGNWADIMPKCASCHTLPHGSKQTQCLACHANPHTPNNVLVSDLLNNNCADCHASPVSQLQQFPSKHTQVACSDCHTSHGYIPSCFMCHEPHYEQQPVASCLPCHPVHQPLQIVFQQGMELKTCSGCHASVYGVWSGSHSKHAQVSCMDCHKQHAQIPSCSECHGASPHNASLHEKFPNCLTCHLDPHDPPVKTR
ncbi:MAG: hypothetical protein P8X63_05675 [Desulfuromonadaceae bacterium]